MMPAYKQKNPTISNVKSLDLWSEWRESNSRPLEPHCASLENTMYNPILPRLSIVKFQMHYTILFHWMSRRFIPFVVKRNAKFGVCEILFGRIVKINIPES